LFFLSLSLRLLEWLLSESLSIFLLLCSFEPTPEPGWGGGRVVVWEVAPRLAAVVGTVEVSVGGDP
jgi:hypothetical protein